MRTLAWPLVLSVLLGVSQALWAEAPVAPPSAAAERELLQLESSSVTGNQELPRVMYIVPWKDAGMGELAGRPVNSLLDEVLGPVDREEFRRQVRYFGELDAAASAAD